MEQNENIQEALVPQSVNEVELALVDEALRFEELYADAATRFEALERVAHDRFPESTSEDRQEMLNRVMAEYYRRKTANMQPSRQQSIATQNTVGQTVIFSKVGRKRDDRHWLDKLDDKNEEIHPPKGAA